MTRQEITDLFDQNLAVENAKICMRGLATVIEGYLDGDVFRHLVGANDNRLAYVEESLDNILLLMSRTLLAQADALDKEYSELVETIRDLADK